jgi:hypothetical protein
VPEGRGVCGEEKIVGNEKRDNLLGAAVRSCKSPPIIFFMILGAWDMSNNQTKTQKPPDSKSCPGGFVF